MMRVMLGIRDQDGQKTDHMLLTLEDIDKKVYMRTGRLC